MRWLHRSAKCAQATLVIPVAPVAISPNLAALLPYRDPIVDRRAMLSPHRRAMLSPHRHGERANTGGCGHFAYESGFVTRWAES